MVEYLVQFVHKIGGKNPKDVARIYLPGSAFSDSRTLGAALREAELYASGVTYPGQARALMAGERVRTFRVEGDKVIVFPDRGPWHSLILEVES